MQVTINIVTVVALRSHSGLPPWNLAVRGATWGSPIHAQRCWLPMWSFLATGQQVSWKYWCWWICDMGCCQIGSHMQLSIIYPRGGLYNMPIYSDKILVCEWILGFEISACRWVWRFVYWWNLGVSACEFVLGFGGFDDLKVSAYKFILQFCVLLTLPHGPTWKSAAQQSFRRKHCVISTNLFGSVPYVQPCPRIDETGY